MKNLRIKFIKNHTPRKKGEVVEFEGNEVKLGEYYLSIGVAEDTEEEEVGGCNCDGSKEVKVEDLKAGEAIELINATEILEDLEKYASIEKATVKKAYDAKYLELTESANPE